jgi:uncharacterized membrane protein
MNASQIHLALNHVPLFFSIAGGLTLIYGFIKKNNSIKLLSLYFMIIGALFTIPVYVTGEGVEEIVENLPAVSESVIEEHEEMAKIGLIIIIVSGITALVSLVLKKKESVFKPLLMICALLSFTTFGVMAQVAHLGGQIRHSELRAGEVVLSNEEPNSANDQKEKSQEKEKEDDD